MRGSSRNQWLYTLSVLSEPILMISLYVIYLSCITVHKRQIHDEWGW